MLFLIRCFIKRGVSDHFVTLDVRDVTKAFKCLFPGSLVMSLLHPLFEIMIDDYAVVQAMIPMHLF